MSTTQNDPSFTPFTQPAAPPYALSTPTFRFRALASLAGRSPLGGPREVVLATFLLARLADDCRPPKALSLATRVARSNAARSWLANTALPSSVRAPMSRLAEATEGELPGFATALDAAMESVTTYLDVPARVELERLARAIGP